MYEKQLRKHFYYKKRENSVSPLSLAIFSIYLMSLSLRDCNEYLKPPQPVYNQDDRNAENGDSHSHGNRCDSTCYGYYNVKQEGHKGKDNRVEDHKKNNPYDKICFALDDLEVCGAVKLLPVSHTLKSCKKA